MAGEGRKKHDFLILCAPETWFKNSLRTKKHIPHFALAWSSKPKDFLSTAIEDAGNVTKLQAQKTLFYSMIKKTADSNNTKMITQEEKAHIVSTIRNWDSLTSKDKLGKKYGWFNKYELFQVGNSEPILFRKKTEKWVS